jgi:hypothetical protein
MQSYSGSSLQILVCPVTGVPFHPSITAFGGGRRHRNEYSFPQMSHLLSLRSVASVASYCQPPRITIPRLLPFSVHSHLLLIYVCRANLWEVASCACFCEAVTPRSWDANNVLRQYCERGFMFVWPNTRNSCNLTNGLPENPWSLVIEENWDHHSHSP